MKDISVPVFAQRRLEWSSSSLRKERKKEDRENGEDDTYLQKSKGLEKLKYPCYTSVQALMRAFLEIEAGHCNSQNQPPRAHILHLRYLIKQNAWVSMTPLYKQCYYTVITVWVCSKWYFSLFFHWNKDLDYNTTKVVHSIAFGCTKCREKLKMLQLVIKNDSQHSS